MFQDAARRWVRGEMSVPGVETWADFRTRVHRAVLDKLHAMPTVPGQAVAVFTSGGPVGATVGAALGLNDEACLEMSWRVRNAAWSELQFKHGQLSLISFNVTPPFEREGMVTML